MRRNFSPFSLCEFGIRIFGRSSPWGLLEQDALILSQHAYFSDLCAFFLSSPVEEDRSFFFLLSSATAESLPFFIELYIELASPSVPEMPADVVLVVRGDGSYPVVDGGLGYRKTLLPHEPARDLLGRPLLPADEFKDPAAEMRRYGAVAGRSGLATPGFQRCQTAVIHSLHIGVAPFLPRNRAYTNTDGLGDETK